jgi:putative thioredoxin
MTAGQAVVDVTDATFQSAVVEQSRTKPVVVDFWAPWCGPCRVLGPIIEKVAAESGGEVVLAKLNVDENPQSAMQFRVQGIPAVKAFRGGRVVDEFTGALPEPQVRQFFASLLPSPTDRLVTEAENLAGSGDTAGAEQRFRQVLQQQADHRGAVLGLARLLAGRGDHDEAESLLKRLAPDREVKVQQHRIFLERYAKKHAGEDLEGEARANPTDPRARYRWGLMLAAREQYREALDELLESVRLNRAWEDDAARKSMLAVFDLLGMDSALTRAYQRKLENVLY